MALHKELVTKVRAALCLPTKVGAETVVSKVIMAIEQTLLEHLSDDGFKLKLESLGGFTVHHTPAFSRKNVFAGGVVKEVPARRKIKFRSMGVLKSLEVADS
jgi:nucleoid DNA-binding protein